MGTAAPPAPAPKSRKLPALVEENPRDQSLILLNRRDAEERESWSLKTFFQVTQFKSFDIHLS